MLTSIGKLTKSFFVKLLVAIIILPFVFWGMGDVFSGGNKNIIASIDSKKISTAEFINYVNRLNLSDDLKKNAKNNRLIEQVLSEYIGRKIIDLEIKDFGIELSNDSLKEIITNDKTFFKNGKFSRTEYEKFLLLSSVSAPAFEQNIIEQEKKRQLLTFLSDGLEVPDFLIENEFRKENQIKKIKYIDLKNFYENKKIEKSKVNEIYNKNKKLFVEVFKSIKFLELKPETLIGKNDYNEKFFKAMDKIENKILDGSNIEEIAAEKNLKVSITKEINNKKKDINGVKFNDIEDQIFSKFFSINEVNEAQIVNQNNKYFIVELSTINKKERGIEDKQVMDAIITQIKIQEKLKNNTKILNEISSGSFDFNEMEKFAKTHKLEIKELDILNMDDNSVFKKELIKNIFLQKDKTLNLLTNSVLSDNFIVYAVNTKYKKLDNGSKLYEEYETKTKLTFAREIYATYDKSINAKYNVELNDKVIDRIRNSF